MALAPQHFQSQRRWLEAEATRALDVVMPLAWGIARADLDADALRSGTLAVIHVRGRFPDGTPVQAPDPDPLPPASSLIDRFSPTRQSQLVYLALAPWRAASANVGAHATEAGPLPRFRRSERTVIDETTGGDAIAVDVAVKNLRVVLDDELTEDDIAMPLARIRRDAGGRFVIDDEYIPPCLQYGASPRLVDLVQRTVSMLEAKSASLAASMTAAAAPAAQAYVGNEVAMRWMLHAIRSAEAPLRHLMATRHAHPEKVWVELSRLAGALCTFSLTVQARDLPLYVHHDPEAGFAALERHLREHLDSVIAARAVVIRLAPSGPSLHTAAVTDARCFEPTARWFIGVQTGLGPLGTAAQFPQHAKVCGAQFVLELVRRAYPGLPLEPVPTPPTSIAPRAEMSYFAIRREGPCAQALLQSRQIGVYVPDSLPDARLEVVVLIPE